MLNLKHYKNFLNKIQGVYDMAHICPNCFEPAPILFGRCPECGFNMIECVKNGCDHCYSSRNEMINKAIKNELEKIFLFAKRQNETFFDGMESIFSRDLHTVINKYGKKAIRIIGMIIKKNEFAHITDEAIIQLGHLKNKEFNNQCFKIFTSNIFRKFDNRHYFLDACVQGIASLNNPKGIPYLQKSLNLEIGDFLQTYVKKIIKELEQTKRDKRKKVKK